MALLSRGRPRERNETSGILGHDHAALREGDHVDLHIVGLAQSDVDHAHSVMAETAQFSGCRVRQYLVKKPPHV